MHLPSPAEIRFQQSAHHILFDLGVEAYHNATVHPTPDQIDREEYQDGIAYADGRDRGSHPKRKATPDIAYSPRQQYAFDRGLEHGRADVVEEQTYLLLQRRQTIFRQPSPSLPGERGAARNGKMPQPTLDRRR